MVMGNSFATSRQKTKNLIDFLLLSLFSSHTVSTQRNSKIRINTRGGCPIYELILEILEWTFRIDRQKESRTVKDPVFGEETVRDSQSQEREEERERGQDSEDLATGMTTKSHKKQMEEKKKKKLNTKSNAR